MDSTAESPVLLIGYGNEVRRDDALGPSVARAVGQLDFAWLRVLTPQQLTPDLAEAVSRARAVVFVDATLNAPPGAIQIGPLAAAALDEPLGHLTSPRSLLALAGAVFDRTPPAWMVTVGVQELGVGEGLSPAVARSVPEVVETVRSLVVRLADRSSPKTAGGGPSQLELALNGDGAGDGYATWQAQRQAAVLALAKKLALPLDHPVEVWFRDGVRLRGRLVLRDPPLFLEDLKAADLELEVDGVRFRAGEIDSLVRLD